MLHFHWYTSLLCREIPVSSQRLFRLRHLPLSCPLQAGIRFLKHPLPSTSFAGLATFIPFFFFFLEKGVYTGYQVPYLGYFFGAVGAVFRPRAIVSVCHYVWKAEWSGSIPFGSGVITLFSPVSCYDPFNDSAFASPWRLFPSRLNRSGSRSSPHCSVGFTPSCYQDRMPR